MNDTNDTVATITHWLGSGSINIFGPQFSGKDTQASKLAEYFDGVVIGGGDIIRGSTFSNEVTDMMNRGELLPTELYVDTVRPFFEKTEYSGKPLLLSAVGRWIGEEQGVIKVCDATNHPIRAVISLKLSDDISLQRWKRMESNDVRGTREDDNESALLRRLELYREKTIPVLKKYDELDLLITIDGAQSPEKVFADIIESLLDLSLR